MFGIVMSILLFMLPGLVSELYFLNLSNRIYTDNKLISSVRALCFSATVLLFRCVISMSRGYGGLPVQDLFLGIGNVGKYIILSAVLSVLMPNAYLLVESLLTKQKYRIRD